MNIDCTSEIPKILKQLEGTSVHEILVKTENIYKKIFEAQKIWYENSNFFCPSGCGACCAVFEPDLLECEALYMAAWLLENQKKTALEIAKNNFPFDNGKACPLYDKNSSAHCSVYFGRAFICRLFGASGSKNKNGKPVWKPCKFYPKNLLNNFNPPIEHKEYGEEETLKLFGAIPPVMSDLVQESIAFFPNSEKTDLLRNILPKAIRFLMWIINMNNNPNGSPNSPAAA